MAAILVHRIPAFNDNYIWLIQPADQQTAFVVDPGDAEPVEQCLHGHKLNLAGILLTHHHNDHVGGVKALTQNRNIPVYGPATERFKPWVTEPQQHGDILSLTPELQARILGLPGHTVDHIGYYFAPQGQSPLLFCGDTLFAGGCGRLFEGSPAQMHSSLTLLTQLPDTTEVYCAHEYTLANLQFASQVEPDNTLLCTRLAQVENLRANGEPTVPTTIASEKATNPFLRTEEHGVKQQAEAHSGQTLANSLAVFAAVRRWKDNA